MAGRAGRGYAYVVAVLIAGCAMLAAPQLGLASSGGAGVSGGTAGGSGSSQTSTPPSGVVQPGNNRVSASGSGVTIVTRASAMLQGHLRFSGRVSPAAPGETIEIERLGSETGWSWASTTHATVRRNGTFSATWVTNHIGRFSIRGVIVAHGPRAKRGVRSGTSSPSLTVTVYRPSIATIFGPGFYGSRTACGQILTRHTLGTANRTLPCGTKVAIEYNGRTIVVPVIDRGPYANHADWDLTQATASALGMNGTATIGAVSLPRR